MLLRALLRPHCRPKRTGLGCCLYLASSISTARAQNSNSFSDIENFLRDSATRPNQTRAEADEKFKQLQTTFVKDSNLLYNIMERKDLRGQFLSILAGNWKKFQDTRIWSIDALSKLVAAKDHTYYLFVLRYLILRGWSDREISLYSTILRSYGRQCLGRQSMVEFWESVKARNDFWVMAADTLIKISLVEGKPLLACSIALRLGNLVPVSALQLVTRSMQYDDSVLGLYYLKALEELSAQRADLVLLASTKREVIRAGMKFSRSIHMSIANDCYDLVSRSEPQPPLETVLSLIIANLKYNQIDESKRIWKKVDYGENVKNIPASYLSRLILLFSKSRSSIKIAAQITKRIPESIFAQEGITEALLIYCGRAHDYELAKKVYKFIHSPIRRSVLTALLNLHVRFDDSTGAQKIINEIQNQGYGLQPDEYALVVRSLAATDFDKAVEFVNSLDTNNALNAYAELANQAANESNFKLGWIFLQKLRDHADYGENAELIAQSISLEIKLHISQSDLRAAKLAWQQWLSLDYIPTANRNTLTALNTILDCALRLNAQEYCDWLANEYAACGFSKSKWRKHIRMRKSFLHLDAESKKRWLLFI